MIRAMTSDFRSHTTCGRPSFRSGARRAPLRESGPRLGADVATPAPRASSPRVTSSRALDPGRPASTAASRTRPLPDAPPAPPLPVQAAMLVIGDEILRGNIADANTAWLAKALHARGVDLVRATVVPDDVADIVATVRDLRERVGPHGAVFTSGGIGPTHDDKTYEAIAAAFDRALVRHGPTVERMQEHYDKRGVELNDARLRMAALPSPAEVLFTEGTWVPLVNVDGVYVLPGIPRLFKQMVGAHLDRFRGPLATGADCFTQMGEGDIADTLSEIAQEFPTVSIGSYPNASGDYSKYKVKISLSSRDQEALAAAMQAVRARLECLE